MNPLQNLTVPQLHELFMETTLEFMRSLEAQASFNELKNLRDKIRVISQAIDDRKKSAVSKSANSSTDANPS